MDKITKNINDVLLNSESDNGYKAQLYKRTNHGHVEFVYAFAGTDDWSDVVDDIDQYYGGNQISTKWQLQTQRYYQVY